MGPGSSCRQGVGTVLLCHCLQWRGHGPARLVLAAAEGLSPLQSVPQTDAHMQGLGRNTASAPVPGEREQSCRCRQPRPLT